MNTTQIQDNIEYIIYRSPLVGTRFTLALAEFIWAITLLWIGETFARPTYAGMAILLPENAWGILFFVMASIQGILLILRDFSSKFAVIFSAVNATIWIYICVSMYMSVYPPPAAISGELALALAASWIFIRSNWSSKNKWIGS